MAKTSKYYSALGRLVLEATMRRKELNMSRKDLARKMGVNMRKIEKFERMGKIPSYDFLISLAIALEGKLFISIHGDYSVVVPKELRKILDIKAMEEKKETQIILLNILIDALMEVQLDNNQ